MLAAKALLLAVAAYVAAGLVFGIYFVGRWVGRIDSAARGAPVSFRILILPGAAALWPVLAARCLRAARADRRT
jgi:hypothetical protein